MRIHLRTHRTMRTFKMPHAKCAHTQECPSTSHTYMLMIAFWPPIHTATIIILSFVMSTATNQILWMCVCDNGPRPYVLGRHRPHLCESMCFFQCDACQGYIAPASVMAMTVLSTGLVGVVCGTDVVFDHCLSFPRKHLRLAGYTISETIPAA